jgi:hypothetical protein
MKYVSIFAISEDGEGTYTDFVYNTFDDKEEMESCVLDLEKSVIKGLASYEKDDNYKPTFYKDYFWVMSKKPIPELEFEDAVARKISFANAKLFIESIDGTGKPSENV